MTVGELVEVLKTYDPELPVVIDGYEGGIEDVKKIRAALVALNDNGENSGVYGPHALVINESDREYRQRHEPQGQIVKAVYIPRTS